MTVALQVEGEFTERLLLERLRISGQMRNAHRHDERTTENGAYGLALLVLCRLTEKTVVSQSWQGTGFDYWLAPEGDDQFQDSILLEISGIRRGTEGAIRGRVREKIIQMQNHSPVGMEHGLIAIVEFSRPLLRVVKP
ncbi:MAG: hypothetical protein ACJ76N_05725 [Thermoanaerobaculia bacterium]